MIRFTPCLNYWPASKSLLQNRGGGHRILGADVARFGDDASCCVVIEQMDQLHWQVIDCQEWRGKDLNYTTGRILSIAKEKDVQNSIIDSDGYGAGNLDTITRGFGRNDFQGFTNQNLSVEKNKDFGNNRTDAAFKLRDLVAKQHICITDELLIQELCTLRFKFQNDGRRVLVSKNEMRKEGIASPNRADGLLYATSLIEDVKDQQDRQYINQPQYSSDDNWDPFKELGIK